MCGTFPTAANRRPSWTAFLALAAWLLVHSPATAQLLPPEAVDLSKVKIEEKIAAADLCPVALTAPNPTVAAFERQGTRYRFSSEAARNQFVHSPEGFIAAANHARWQTNFVRAMSPVWCPVTDQVNPGGFGEFDQLGLKWRTCCQFCKPEVVPDCYTVSLARLKERANTAYELTRGVYAQKAPNPIAGALRAVEDFNGNLVVPKLETSTVQGGTIANLPKTTIEDARFDRGYGEWRHYGGDRGHNRYSSLSQINRNTFKNLKVAWRWETVDVEVTKANPSLRPGAFKPTPLMIGGVLYTSTSFSQIAAIDAGTGKTIWVYDPKSYLNGRPANSGFQHRGVEYWTDGKIHRILIATGGRQLVSVDALTGKPDPNFGTNGMVDLTEGLGREFDKTQLGYNSPVVVCRDTIVVGCVVFDYPANQTTPPGHIRGFDVRTGKMKWIFHTIPQPGEFGHDTWEQGSWKTAGGANVWSTMSADEELGFVYLPIGTPSNDYYGGHRLGNGLFGESLVCLNAETGKRVWHFQGVHHGLWDYDFCSGPNLVDIKKDGKTIKAVAQVSKQGFCFVFDRVNGTPLWPIEERPVPPTDVPGERISPTQPFPTKPAAYERQTIFDDDLVDFTPEIKKKALEIANEWRRGPMFLPPSVPGTEGKKGSLVLPAAGGGANWAGAAVDPATGMLYVPSWTRPLGFNLKKTEGNESGFRYNIAYSGTAGPEGLPLVKPPYYRVTAIDLTRGEHAWQIPLGDGPRNHPAIRHLKLGPLGYSGGSSEGKGGGILTGGLLIIAQFYDKSYDDKPNPKGALLHAFDQKTGAPVAQIALDGYPLGTPMTYLHQGRQHIVVSTMNDQGKSELIALALGE